MTYQEMNAQNQAVSNDEAERDLLRIIIGELSPSMRRKIAARLEKERKHFSNSSTPGHLVWYEHKLALCAAMERLT